MIDNSPKCPKCGSAEFERGKNQVAFYIHVRCKGCASILFEAVDGHFDTHGYCGSPAHHWEQANA